MEQPIKNVRQPIAIYYNILQFQIGSLQLLNEKFDVTVLETPNDDTDDILANAQIIFAPLGYRLDEKKIRTCKSLKVIASNTTGHPHIDVEFAKKIGIKVITLKNESEFLNTITPTAELTLGLIIALSRNLIPANDSVNNGQWDRRPYGGKKMLSRMDLGIIGLGRLGRMVANYGSACGMRVRYYDPLVGGVARYKRVGTLTELVAQSDVVTLHVPHEESTELLVDSRVLTSFRNGAIFVNTSRGELVDHDTLLECLMSGQIGGAALDVLEGEFIPGFSVENHPLWNYAQHHQNIILTPHIGGSTQDAWQLTEEYTISKVVNYLDKQRNSSND